MIKGKRTNLIEMLYKDEIAAFVYETYKGSDTVPHIRTFALLNDGFNTLIKLEELGQLKKELILELESCGFISLNNKENSLQLKKTA